MAEMTLLNIMWLLIIILLIFVIRLLWLYIKTINKIKFYAKEARYFGKMNNQENILMSKFNNQILFNLKKLKSLKCNAEFKEKKEFDNVINNLNEIYNNIEVIVNPSIEAKTKGYNIEKEIKRLITKINIVDSVKVQSEKNIKNLNYDNVKIISALKLILLETLKNDVKPINIFISICDDSKLIIKLENVNLFKQYDEQDIEFLKKFFKRNNYSQYLDINISPELYLIRANLICVAENVYFDDNNNMIIEINTQIEKD